MHRRTAVVLSALLALGLAAPGCSDSRPSASAPDASVAETVRRLASILDYVAADYAEAVEDGVVVDQAEYDEQLAFIDDALALTAELPPPPAGAVDLAGSLQRLREAIDRKAATDEVADAARAIRTSAMNAYGVVVAPAGAPSYGVGEALYRNPGNDYAACTQCHGDDGAADTPMAKALVPPPRSFLDPEVMAGLSPVRAFNALTDGIEDTGMIAYGRLSASERWSLAFYVFTMRHTAEAAARGRTAFEDAGRPVAATPSRLANLRDEELLAELTRAGLAPARAMDALAYLRREAAFEQSGAPMDQARQHLARMVVSYRDGDPAGARRAAAAAYLDGFEPHEGKLRTVDADSVVRIEQQFLALREAVAGGAPADEVEQRALRIGAMLDGADELLGGHSGARVAFASAFAILLREGLEGALLVLLLLGIARRSGAERQDERAVHLGWIAAVGLGVVTWLASGALLGRLGGAQRELIEGVVALLAAAVLLAVSHFVLARLDAQRRVAALKDRLAAAASTPRRRWVLGSLGFVAVYREAFETVLFLRAILLDATTPGWAVLLGAITGIAVLVALVFVMAKLGKRLRPAPLLSALGALLCVLAVVLAGKGVRSLQEAGVIGIEPLAGPRLDWIGLYPTAQTILAQALVLTTFIGLAVWAVLRNRSRADSAAAT